MLNSRQEQILLSLKRFDYLTVQQFKKLHDLKGDRNAYRIINQLKTYMSSFKDNGINVLYLNKKGREVVNADKVRRKLTSAKHYMMRNDLYIDLGRPINWQNEVRAKYESGKDKIIVVADAHYTTLSYPHDKHHLIEIDHTQKMQKNRLKIEKYRRLIEKGVFKGMPELIWVTTSSYRQSRLLDLCDGLDVKCYLSSDFQ